jgi:hypothetical protein
VRDHRHRTCPAVDRLSARVGKPNRRSASSIADVQLSDGGRSDWTRGAERGSFRTVGPWL